MQAYTVEPLYVKSGQDVIAADFYRPKNIEKPAVILMAHGLAALRQFKLVQYAQRFASAGYAVVLFDYRYWGGSTGRPRELVSINAQLDDWRTMIRHIQERKSIDSKRIVLWGVLKWWVCIDTCSGTEKYSGGDGTGAFCRWCRKC